MKFPVLSVADLGILLRATRKAQRIRIDDLAGSAGVGPVFVRDVEHGKPSVEFGRVLKLLVEIGIVITAEIPDSAHDELKHLQARGLRPLKSRTNRARKRPRDAE